MKPRNRTLYVLAGVTVLSGVACSGYRAGYQRMSPGAGYAAGEEVRDYEDEAEEGYGGGERGYEVQGRAGYGAEQAAGQGRYGAEQAAGQGRYGAEQAAGQGQHGAEQAAEQAQYGAQQAAAQGQYGEQAAEQGRYGEQAVGQAEYRAEQAAGQGQYGAEQAAAQVAGQAEYGAEQAAAQAAGQAEYGAEQAAAQAQYGTAQAAGQGQSGAEQAAAQAEYGTEQGPGVASSSMSEGYPSASMPVYERTSSIPAALRNRQANLKTAISSRSVNQLRLAWRIGTDSVVTHAPIVDAGRVYFADWAGRVYAADASTGRIIWRHSVQAPRTDWAWYGFGGTGVLADGLLIEASVEGMAYGLDPMTGDVVWQTRFTDQPTAGNLAKLLAHNGLVYIGISSVDEPLAADHPGYRPTARGGVVALDTRTGRKVWETFTVRAPGNGCAVWSSFALDPDLNLLYFNTGNNYTGRATAMSDAMVAVRPDTGRIVWSHQALAGDVWVPSRPLGPDYDFGAGPQFFVARRGNKVVRLVGAGAKSGIYYAFDRITGKLVWKTRIGLGGQEGGIRAEASISDSRIIVWSNNRLGDEGYRAPTLHPIHVRALDPSTGRIIWSRLNFQPVNATSAGFLANDVYFVGAVTGHVRGLRASDGKLVFSSRLPGPTAVGSSIVVSGDMMMVGGGLPRLFGGQSTDRYGLYGWRLGAKNVIDVSTKSEASGK